MSGGLARDLIRTCRDMLERVQVAPTENGFEKLCNYLITSDVQGKLRATAIAVKKRTAEPEKSQFFDIVRQLETLTEASPLSLKEVARQLNTIKLGEGTQSVTGTKPDIAQKQQESEEKMMSSQQAEALMIEASVYLYYAATLLDYFASKPDVDAWKAAEKSNDFDQLARIRQSFSISTHVAYTMIASFRRGHHLDILELKEHQV